jgi:hypothetical protein
MRSKILTLSLLSIFNCAFLISCKGQESYGEGYLKLVKNIPLPNVKGRLDHIAIDERKQIAYIAALGNNTVEVADLKDGRVVHSIGGLDEPQGVAYIASTNEVFVANGGNGECYFFNAATFTKVATVTLPSDADDVQFKEASGKIYVGYGKGGIAVINASSHQKVDDFKLPAHPESFQVDEEKAELWVNLPDAGMVGVINLTTRQLKDKWRKTYPRANFPMAYDRQHDRLYVGYRFPARMITFNTLDANEVRQDNIVGDADDLFLHDNKIYISGGEGSINIFERKDRDSLKQVANIRTKNGARTSLLVPRLKLFLVAVRSTGGEAAKISVYKLNK